MLNVENYSEYIKNNNTTVHKRDSNSQMKSISSRSSSSFSLIRALFLTLYIHLYEEEIIALAQQDFFDKYQN